MWKYNFRKEILYSLKVLRGLQIQAFSEGYMDICLDRVLVFVEVICIG